MKPKALDQGRHAERHSERARPTSSADRRHLEVGKLPVLRMAEMGSLLPMFTLGHKFVPPRIHAGGLRYHGDSPLLSELVRRKLVEARAYGQAEVFKAAITFARTEGIIAAPETAHAIKAVIDKALEAKRAGEPRVILFNLSGHGHFELAAYEAFLNGNLGDYELPEEDIKKALGDLEGLPKAE